MINFEEKEKSNITIQQKVYKLFLKTKVTFQKSKAMESPLTNTNSHGY